MQVTIRHVGYLNLTGVENGASVKIDVSTSVENLLDRFRVRKEHQRYIVPVINGRKARLSTILRGGDSLFLHLPVGGG
jgi:hypothetical protein